MRLAHTALAKPAALLLSSHTTLHLPAGLFSLSNSGGSLCGETQHSDSVCPLPHILTRSHTPPSLAHPWSHSSALALYIPVGSPSCRLPCATSLAPFLSLPAHFHSWLTFLARLCSGSFFFSHYFFSFSFLFILVLLSVSLLYTVTMCDFTKNYYIYTSCVDPGAHYFGTSVDGNRHQSCSKGPHERYIVLPGQCPLCCG